MIRIPRMTLSRVLVILVMIFVLYITLSWLSVRKMNNALDFHEKNLKKQGSSSYSGSKSPQNIPTTEDMDHMPPEGRECHFYLGL